MDSSTFSGLQEHFISKLSDVQFMVEVRDAIKDDDSDCLHYIQSLNSEVDHFRSATALMRGELQRQKDKLQNLQNANCQFNRLIERLNYTLNHIPERLPKPHQESEVSSTEDSCDRKQSSQKADTVKSASGKLSTQPAPRSSAVAQPQPQPSTNKYYPEIEYLKVDEFSEIPKYLKGRITYEQVNKFIDGMNKAYLSKYKLLKQKKSSLNDFNRKKYEKYKSQESKDTTGCYFVTDEDIKDYGGLKIDSVGRSIQTILRHCKRVREVRGGKITRIVYNDSY